ncbi:MAG TPA: cysteine desulfurase family protein [Actinomycetota bacterium]|nr:cysteine desulfurase family protein [Actinomycetota bacterium]
MRPYDGSVRYLDYAATTPVLDEVVDAMLPYLRGGFGNPSSVYAVGREAKKGLEESREQLAEAIGATPGEIVFTAGGTEADNLALKGAAFRARSMRSNGNHVITTAVEHHAVLHSAEWLERHGFRVTFLPVNAEGVVDLEALAAALGPETVLVSIMLANNEVGTIEPVAEAAALTHERSRALIHTDAVQALGKLVVDVEALGVDLASFAAHKIGGPKGTGALYVRRKTPIEAILHGGGQERDLRSGTPNVAGIVGMAEAARIASAEVAEESARLSALRDRLQDRIEATIPAVKLNGAGADRVPGTVNLCIEGVEGESLLLMLDARGIAASSGSACTSGSLEPSHVLMAMGVPPELAHGSLRLSLGRGSTGEDVDAVLEVLPAIVQRLRSIAPGPVPVTR